MIHPFKVFYKTVPECIGSMNFLQNEVALYYDFFR